MIRSFLIKLGAAALVFFALAAGWSTGDARADVIIAKSGIGGRTQLVDPMDAVCEHKTYLEYIDPQTARRIWVHPSYVRQRGVSGEAIYARVRIRQYYATGWQDRFVTGWQSYKLMPGVPGYYINSQTGIQWEAWDFLAAGHYQAYVDYLWYAGGRLVGTATAAAERSDWEVVDDGFGLSAWKGSTDPGQVGYCFLPI
jgi:hypothetical protein